MRVFLAFAVLLAGVAAVAANLAEPRRYVTEMAPLTQGDGRIASFAAIAAQGTPVNTPAQANLKVSAAETAAPQPLDVPAFTTTQTIAPVNSSPLDAATHAALARDIQSELARLGCYAGPVDGSWTPDTQRAAGQFVATVNARMPTIEPDFALFSLAKSATEKEACGPAITVAQAPVVPPPTMGLGGPGSEGREAKAVTYQSDTHVESLFTNPLGR